MEPRTKAEEAGRALEEAGKGNWRRWRLIQVQGSCHGNMQPTISAAEAEIGALLATAAPEEGSLLRFLRGTDRDGHATLPG